MRPAAAKRLFALTLTTTVGLSFSAQARWLTLDEAIERARSRSVDVIEARGQLDVANSGMARARLAPIDNPYVEMQLDHGEFTKDVAITSFIFLPLELAGHRGRRVEEIRQLSQWKQNSLAGEQFRVTAQVVALWGRAAIEAARLREAEKAGADAKAQLEAIQNRLKYGDVTVYEKSLAESEVARWEQLAGDSQVSFIQTRALLAELTGETDLDSFHQAKEISQVDPEPLRNTWTHDRAAEIVEQTPVLKNFRAEQDYWSAYERRAIAEKYPALNLIGNVGRGDSGELRAGGGLSWTLPIFRRNQGEIARAQAERSRLRSLESAVRSTLLVRLRGAHEAYQTAREVLKKQDSYAIPAAEKLVDAAWATYRAGKTEYTLVLFARRELILTRTRRLELSERAWQAYAEIAGLTGVLP